MAINNLYEACNEFRIVDVDNVVYPNIDNPNDYILIREPDLWPGLTLSGLRTIPEWGFDFVGSGEGQVFGYQCGNGGQALLQAIQDDKGGDGQAVLQLFVDGTLEKEYDILFNRLVADRVTLQYPVKERKFQDKVRSRRKTKVFLNATETIDGTTLTALDDITVDLPDKALLFFSNEKFSQDEALPAESDNQSPLFAGTFNFDFESYVQYGFDEIVTQEVQELFDLPYSWNANVPASNFTAEVAGIHNVSVGDSDNNFSFEGSIEIQEDGPGQSINSRELTFELRIQLNNDPPTIISTFTTVANDVLNFSDDVDFQISYNLGIGDELRLYCYFLGDVNYTTPSDDGITIEFNFEMKEDSFWQIQLRSEVESTTATGIPIHELCRRTMEIISDVPGIFRSDFLGLTELEYFENGAPINYPSDGCGGKILNMNGFAIRNFDPNDRPLQSTHEMNMEAIFALFNMGWNWERNSFGELKFRAEPIAYFFQDVEVMRIDDIYAWETRYSWEEVTFNKITVGYKDNSTKEDDPNTLDDIHVQHEYLTPIIRRPQENEVNYDAICPFIASVYTKEKKRREQFENEPTTGDKFDEDVFMYAMRRDGGAPDGWIIETDQPFSTFDNVLDPDEYDSARYSPTRNFLNHASFVNSGLFVKDATDEITFRFAEGNYDCRTQFAGGEPCPNGDPDLDLIVEGANILMEDFNQFKRIFDPYFVVLETTLTWDQYKHIQDVMMNASTLGDNYGYFTAQNPLLEEDWQLYLWNIDYTPENNIAKMRFLKKNPDWTGA